MGLIRFKIGEIPFYRELHKIFDFIRSLVGLLFLHEQRVKVVPARDLDDWRDNE